MPPDTSTPPREHPAAMAAADHLRRQYEGAAAVIFYGSCLRDNTGDGQITSGLLDFYVLVDSYRSVMSAVAAFWARLLPPNVYLYECDDTSGGRLRAKVAVMRLDQFLDALGPRQFTSTVSARFAQPAAILYARDQALQLRLTAGFTIAAETTVARTLPLMPVRFTARDLWRRAFTESFAAEFRPESKARIDSLVDGDLAFYTALTSRILGESEADEFHHTLSARDLEAARAAWPRRRMAGKALNALRLVKAAFTFKGGLDYAAWKIRRHSGVDIAVTDDDRRKPLRAGLRLFAQSLRRGVLK